MKRRYKINQRKYKLRLYGSRSVRHAVSGLNADDEAPGTRTVARRAKTDKRRRAILDALLFICVCAFIYSAYMLLKTHIENTTAGKEYDDILSSYVDNDPNATARPIMSDASMASATPRQGRTIPPYTPKPGVQSADAENVTSEEPPDDKSVGYVVNTASKEWPKIDFDGLLRQNKDFIAWISIPGTNINYPVVWRPNDTENTYYLKHTFQGKENRIGAIFIEGNNKPDFTDLNTIIYGHNIKNHSMFWTLTSYRDQSFFNAHPFVRISTPYGNYIVEIFSAYDAKPGTDSVWTIHFGSEDSYFDWINTQAKKSLVQTTTVVSDTDRFVTLSTCSYVFTDARFVLVGKLVATDLGDFRSDEYFKSHPRPNKAVEWQTHAPTASAPAPTQAVTLEPTIAPTPESITTPEATAVAPADATAYATAPDTDAQLTPGENEAPD